MLTIKLERGGEYMKKKMVYIGKKGVTFYNFNKINYFGRNILSRDLIKLKNFNFFSIKK